MIAYEYETSYYLVYVHFCSLNRGLKDRMRIQIFSYDKYFQDYDKEHFVRVREISIQDISENCTI